MIRRLGRPAIHFKGSGWYITDSKKSGGESKGTNGNGRSTEKGEEKSESKTAGEKVATNDTAPASDAAGKSNEKKADTAKTSTTPAE